MGIMDVVGKKILFFDGGMGSLLQEKGLRAGELPEIWNIDNKQVIIDIHKNYFDSGSDIIITNTFGCNGLKFSDYGKYSVRSLINAGVANAKQAVAETICKKGGIGYIALDIGPCGKLLKPLGDIDFEDAYNLFKEMAIEGEKSGADLILIETMSDTYEIKAAVLAAKENTKLPIFATVAFDDKGNLLTGGDVQSVVSLLEGLGVDALGMNCGLGPIQMKGIMSELVSCTSLPIIVNPNAGLPKNINGKTVYDITPLEFAETMKEITNMGACIIGGCCGTTPEHIYRTHTLCCDIKPKPIVIKNKTVVSSYSHAVEIGNDPILIGERINPTGKSRFKQALRDKDMEYILREGITQQQNGAHVLDVNVGLPDINETEMMVLTVKELQSIIDLPLQIDTTNIEAMESAMRIYNGKPLINSVNGKKESMEAIFPLVKKYGGVVVGLALDEHGIPDTAIGRLNVAKKIVDTAAEYGISKNDIVIDVLAMTVSSDEKGALTTIEALKLVRENLGVNTILGVSNISFGLPQREIINSVFFSLALQNGLTSAIINPNSDAMMKSYYAYRALSGIDNKCTNYIAKYSNQTGGLSVSKSTENDMTLSEAIIKGLKEKAFTSASQMVETIDALKIINTELIPALDSVGKGFEKGTTFLPQLLMSAEAAKSAFEAIKAYLDKSGIKQSKKDKIILATVKGDIHDIGKNIVKVLLENYSYDIIDLGKDVEPSTIADAALAHNVKLVGLSALMTTTVVSMEETIKCLRKTSPQCKIMVGGAVLTQEYADMIDADHYAKDAMASVYYAQKVLTN